MFVDLALVALAIMLEVFRPSIAMAQQPDDPPPLVSRAFEPVPGWAKSVEVVAGATRVYSSYGYFAIRRGAVVGGTRLPVRQKIYAPGCRYSPAYYETENGLYICADQVELSTESPSGVPQPPMQKNKRLPLRYAFVREDETPYYEIPEDYFIDEPAGVLFKGFGVIADKTITMSDVTFTKTTRRSQWIVSDALGEVGGSRFSGVQIEDGGSANIGWVRSRRARLYDEQDGASIPATYHKVVRIQQVDGQWAELDDGKWMRLSDLSRVIVVSPPEEVAEGERWIDVNIDEQVVVAYDYDTPVFATLTSSGRGKKEFETPKGRFRIWAKLVFADMDNTDIEEDLERAYSLRKVPWVLFFKDAIGFHTAYWHNDFGRRRSHGCLNLAPADARYLFNFTHPALPDGWKAILPTTEERATLVQVR